MLIVKPVVVRPLLIEWQTGRPGSGPLSNVPKQLHREPVLLPPWNWYC